MGCTTEIAGQCGVTMSPALDTMPAAARAHFEKKTGPLYRDMQEQLAAVDRMELGTNQHYFCGHGPVRGSILGLQDRLPTEEEIRQMQDMITQAIAQGAAGFSTGLSYIPGIYSDTHELTELSRAAGRAGGIYTTHSRSESMGLFDSVAECIHIAREANISVNISHFKCVGKPFWQRCDQALGMIDDAVAQGLDVTLDAYPYTAASTTTLSAIPPKYLTGGGHGLAQMLHDPKIAEAIRHEIYEVNDPSWDNSMYYVGLENFLIVRAAETPEFIGKTYAEAAQILGMEPFDAVVHLLKLNDGNIYECRFSMCEENVEAILKHPRCMVGSDGIFMKGDKSCHPRAMGTFPRYLGHYIRQRQILSREEGIHRITGMTAQRYGLTGKGFIKEGFDADLVLFDYDNIIDRADFLDPFKPNEGIHQVYIDGRLVLENNEPTGVWCGKYLRRQA
jgi:N-acyl-D-aspartate/D-glutamate deacylase